MGLKKLKKQNPCVIDRSRDGKTAGSFKVLHSIGGRPHILANVMSGMAIYATLLLSHQRVHATAIQSYVLLVAGLPLTLHTNTSLNRLMMYREQF